MIGWPPSRRRLAAALAAAALVLSGPGARGQDAPPPGLPPGANLLCPVMEGEPVDPDFFADHEGRRVYFCCGKCRGKFAADPATYAARLAGLPLVVDVPTPVPPQAEERGGSSPPPPPAAGVPPAPAGEAARANWMTATPYARLAGRLHIAAVHFPIALLVIAALIEFARSLAGRAGVSPAARTIALIGAVTAGVAAGMGWVLAEAGDTAPSLDDALFWHRWLGVGAAGVACAGALLGLGAGRVKGLVVPYRLLLLGAAALVGAAGHFGGTLVHGRGYILGPLLGGAAERSSGGAPPPAPRAGPTAPPGPGDGGALAGLFATDPEGLMLARRRARLALLPQPPRVPEVSGPAFNEIDRFILASWKERGLSEADEPPPVCDDAAFLRRVYLDVVGVVPTLAEAERFLADGRPDRRARLVDELLARDADYADHWTPFWEDALGSTNVNNQGGVPGRGNYKEWINASFRANKPFDLFAAELIDPALPGRRPPQVANANGRETRTQFIMNESHTATLQSAAIVGQVFMGTAMKCASCHNHFENAEWPQDRFLAFAGLFSGGDLERIRCEQPSGQTVAAAFPFEIPGAPAGVPAGEEARLARAAQLLTDPLNPRFAKATVNRLWKRSLGLGLFEPADDFRPDRAPAQAELLEWLAHDFMTHGYDPKRTARLILASRTYQLAYNPALEDRFDVERPDAPRHMRSPSLRRLTAEQLLDSVRVATGQRLDPASRLFRDSTSTALMRALGRPASRNEISTGRPDDAAIVQALELLNGPEYAAITSSGALVALALDQPTAAEAADLLCRAVLTRGPTPQERRLFEDFLDPASWSLAAAELPPPREVAWIDGGVPEGAGTQGFPDAGWLWEEVGGRRAHRQDAAGKQAQHLFLGAAPAFVVGPADTLFTEVHLDAADPPAEVMLQWNDGTGEDGGWAHRAYWGDNTIRYGQDGTASRRAMGPLPRGGEWVRLEIPAADVGLGAGRNRVVGMSFDQAGGTVHWARSGVVTRGEDPRAQRVADVLWALFTSAEFQYVR